MINNTRKDLANVITRVHKKRKDYIRYNFSPKKNDILKTFFDLTQECEEITDFYRISVAILLEAFGVESRLYLLGSESSGLKLVCDSHRGVLPKPSPPPEHIYISSESYEVNDSIAVPILCGSNNLLDDDSVLDMQNLGVLEVYPIRKLTESDKFFLTRYTSRIGYNLRKRLLAQQNISHLNFINTLVSDIEHNVIVPNMYFKYLFKQLHKRINDIREIHELIGTEKEKKTNDPYLCQVVFDKLSRIQDELEIAYQEIDNHHVTYSLFLESLFRRDHFEKGRLVLRHQLINVDREIIRPQLNHYRRRLLARNIAIEEPSDLAREDYSIKADLGLLAQVYANLFSNAVKYTQSIIDRHGSERKAVAYGRKILPDYYGFGKPGIKLNVFTSGPHLSKEERENVFLDGYQGSNSFLSEGKGHGLAFVKYVIELHGGTVGYDSTEQGNNFYFILPLES